MVTDKITVWTADTVIFDDVGRLKGLPKRGAAISYFHVRFCMFMEIDPSVEAFLEEAIFFFFFRICMG